MEAPWQSIETSAASNGLSRGINSAIAQANRVYFGEYRVLRAHVFDQLEGRAPLTITREQWMAATNRALATLMQVSRDALGAAGLQADANLLRARHDLAVALGLMGFSIGLAALAVVIVLTRVIHPLRTMTLAIRGERDMAGIAELARRGDEIGQLRPGAENVSAKMCRRPPEAGARIAAATRWRSETAETASKHQVGIPGQYEPRAAHAAERGDRLFRSDDAGTFGAAAERYLGICQADQRFRQPSAQPGGRHSGPGQDRGRPLFQATSAIRPAGGRVEDCLPLIAQRRAAREIVLEADMPRDAIWWWPMRAPAKQILINLLSNAVKFSEARRHMAVSLHGSRATMVQFAVRDEGVGIPADVLARIGQPFEQVAKSACWRAKAPGWACRWSRRWSAAHGGTFAVESREDVGTTVTVRLPRRQHQLARAAA